MGVVTSPARRKATQYFRVCYNSDIEKNIARHTPQLLLEDRTKQIMGEQSKRISCLKESVSENLNRLLERWNIVDDKNLFSQELLQDVPKLTQESQNLMDKALK